MQTPTQTYKQSPQPQHHEQMLRRRQCLPLHRLLKDLQRRLRRIKRHLMPRPKNPQKAEIIHRLKSAGRGPVDRVARQRLRRERCLARIGNGVGGREPAEPVADPVGVTGPDDGRDARLDDVGELREEGAGVVARGSEFLVGCVGAFLVGRLGADGLDDVRPGQVGGVGFGRVGVVGRSADIVDVKVGDLRKGAFDTVVAGRVAGFAVGIAAARVAFVERRRTFAVVGV